MATIWHVENYLANENYSANENYLADETGETMRNCSIMMRMLENLESKLLLKIVESWGESLGIAGDSWGLLGIIWRTRNARVAAHFRPPEDPALRERFVMPPGCLATVYTQVPPSLLAVWPEGSLCTLRTSSCACRRESSWLETMVN